MNVIGIIGSPRKKGNTELLTAHALKAVASTLKKQSRSQKKVSRQ